jgi:hypothetical protein
VRLPSPVEPSAKYQTRESDRMPGPPSTSVVRLMLRSARMGPLDSTIAGRAGAPWTRSFTVRSARALAGTGTMRVTGEPPGWMSVTRASTWAPVGLKRARRWL